VVNPEEHAIGAQRMRRFYRAFLELPDHYREAVLMVTIDGRDYEEAARILGVPVGTIRSRIHQGRKLLKLAMEEP
jgi:RNA polymerase sigma-70 factor (ECF subfamily)